MMARSGVVIILFCFIWMSKAINECDLFGICKDDDSYPTELANKLIEELKSKNVTFNVDQPPEGVVKIQPRFEISKSDGNPDFVQIYDVQPADKLCNSFKGFWAPHHARDINNEIQQILNNNDPIQQFYIESCQNNTSDKKSLCNNEGTLMNYKAVCNQKYMLKEMYYISNGQAAKKYFYVPICCSCDLISETK